MKNQVPMLLKSLLLLSTIHRNHEMGSVEWDKEICSSAEKTMDAIPEKSIFSSFFSTSIPICSALPKPQLEARLPECERLKQTSEFSGSDK